VSWKSKSIPALARITPLRPPIVNRKINPQVKIRGGFIIKLPPHKVANHEKILIPVGTAIVIVALEK
jgi:hypothetical protein